MLFPDARSRVPVPSFSNDDVAELKKKLYRPAFVEPGDRQEVSFAFLRPPGWEVGPPGFQPTEELPIPFLASIRRKAPDAGLEIALYEATHDCLPGDFLDCVLDGLTCTHISEGRVGAGWYADRSAQKEHGAEFMAAHRRGKDLFVFMGAARKDGGAKVRNEILAILGTFSLRQERASPFAGRWKMVADARPLAFAAPDGVKTVKAPAGGTVVNWPLEGGAVELGMRPCGPKERSPADAAAALTAELKKKGIVLAPNPANHVLPVDPGGALAGDATVTTWQSGPASKQAVEVTLLVGTTADGTAMRLWVTCPARTAHKINWMQGRFAFVQMVTTLGMQPTG